MTPQELQVSQKIASVMRAARKRLGLNQTDIATKLGISQSALSKVESGLLVPSAPQWFVFCEATGVSPDSLTTGAIERGRPATLESAKDETGFRMANKYRDYRGSKSRAMLPFLAYFRSIFGEQGLEDYFRFVRVDGDMFVDYDAQINLNFCLDISRELIQRGVLKAKDFPKLIKPVSQPQTHGSLHTHYDGANAVNLISALVLNARQYECNFKYGVEDQKKDQITISVTPEAHLKEFKYNSDPVLGDFLCRYKQAYFERFSTYGGASGLAVRESECHYKGADRCVYHLKLAG